MLTRGKHAVSDQTTDSRRTDVERFGSFIERRLAALRTLPFAIDSDVVVIAQGSDAGAGPGIALASRHPARLRMAAIVGSDSLTGQGPHQLHHIGVDAPAMLSCSVLAHAQRCVIVARPPDDEIEAVLFYPHNDLFDQHANDSFARSDRGSFGMPCALDIGAELQQGLSFDGLTPPDFAALSASSSSWRRCSSFKHSFQRRSSSPATRRLSGSTASYCRRAC